MRKGLSGSLIAGVLCLTPLAAPASIVSFSINTYGSAEIGEDCGAGCSIVSFSGVSGLDGLVGLFPGDSAPSFSFTGQMPFTEFGSYGSGNFPPDGTWSLTDGSGDSLFGQFGGGLSGSPEDEETGRSGQFYYATLGGSGVFEGAQGVGFTLLSFNDYPDEYSETGAFTLDVPDPVSVPEPGSLALLGAGLTGLLWTTRRRRAIQPRFG